MEPAMNIDRGEARRTQGDAFGRDRRLGNIVEKIGLNQRERPDIPRYGRGNTTGNRPGSPPE